MPSSNHKRRSGNAVKTVAIVLLILALMSIAAIVIGYPAGFGDKTSYQTETLEISADTTSGNCDSEFNYADTLSLNSKLFNVRFTSGSASRNAYLSNVTSGTEIRLYSGGDGNGNTLTVESEKNIVYIELEFSSSSGVYTLNGDEFTNADTRHIINSSSFTIQNVDTTGSVKVLIKKIHIVYEE